MGATKPRTTHGKASLAEIFFQKLFGKRRACHNEGYRAYSINYKHIDQIAGNVQQSSHTAGNVQQYSHTAGNVQQYSHTAGNQIQYSHIARQYSQIARYSHIARSCQNPRILVPGPYIIDRFIGHSTFQMTGQAEDRFWVSRVRCPTKASFFARHLAIGHFFRVFFDFGGHSEPAQHPKSSLF